MDCEPGKSKRLARGNLEEIRHKSNSNYHKGATRLSLSLSLPTSHPHVLYSFPLNKYFVSLLFIFVGIFFCKTKGPGPWSQTTGLVARIWCSHHHDQASVSGGCSPASPTTRAGVPPGPSSSIRPRQIRLPSSLTPWGST